MERDYMFNTLTELLLVPRESEWLSRYTDYTTCWKVHVSSTGTEIRFLFSILSFKLPAFNGKLGSFFGGKGSDVTIRILAPILYGT